MFEELFIRRGAVTGYHAAPFHDERLSYLRHCAEAGSRPTTLRVIAAHQRSLVHFLDLRKGDRVSVAQVEAAADRWSLPGGRHSRQPALPQARQKYIGHAVRWLRFMGVLEESVVPRHRHASEVAVFEAWMREECGWSEHTISGCVCTVDGFFDMLDERKIALAGVEIADIDREAARWHARGCSRITVHDYAQRLRTFFRFAERRGWCTPGLAEGIMPPRFHPGEPLPKGLNRDEIEQLLATTESGCAADIRDQAILRVLITYGLRAGEVGGLRLGDIDWQDDMLRVRRPKPGRTHHYPLSPGVGKAILRYLREVRPQRRERSLFLTLNAPLRPLSSYAVWHVVNGRLKRIGITGKRRCGPHALRHGAAQHLLDHGLSMKEVGDYLGHRSISATSAYAKVQLRDLREVADIDLEDLL